MKKDSKKVIVMLRAMHDSKTRRKPGDIKDHPAMKRLTAMIESGELSADRTVAFLNADQEAQP